MVSPSHLPSARFSSATATATATATAAAAAAAALPSASSAHLHSLSHHFPLFLPPSAGGAATSSPSSTSSSASSPPPPPPPRHLLYPLPPLLSELPTSNAMHLTMNCNSNVDSSPDLATSSSSHSETLLVSTRSGSFSRDAPAPSTAASLMRYHSAPSTTLSSAMAEQEPPPLITNFLSQGGRVASYPNYANLRDERPVQQKQAGFVFSRSRADNIGALHSESQGNLCSSGETLDRNDLAADHYRQRPVGALQLQGSAGMLEAMDQAIASSSDRQQPPPPPLRHSHHSGGAAGSRSTDFHLPVRMMSSRSGHGLMQHSLQAQENGYNNNNNINNEGHGKAVGLLRHVSSPAGFLAQSRSSMDHQGTSSGNSRSSEEGGSSFATAAVSLLQQQHYNFAASAAAAAAAAAAGFSNWEHDMAPSSSASNNNNNLNHHENYRKRQLRDCDGFFSPHADSQNGSALEQGGLVNHFTLGTSTSPEDIYFTDRLSVDTVPCRMRAKRGCATHPRSIAERVRRTKISDRMKKLQELVPNMDKQTNIAEMLDEAVEYVKGLQREVQRLTEAQEKCRCSCNKSQEKN